MSNKEIGGYFQLENLCGKEYYSDLIALNTARNALVYLLKSKGIKKIVLPYFLCESVSQVCDREGIAYEYYSISNDFMPIFDKKLALGEYLYVVNYYGQLDNMTLKRLKDKYECVIVDNVQAFFQKPIEGIDTIYSCRKFFGVPDGAYLSTQTFIQEPLEMDESRMRMEHVLGRLEKTAADFYHVFKENDRSFIGLQLKTMSLLTHNILGAIDYEKVRQQRKRNYRFLDGALKKINLLSARIPDGPYAYPFYCKNGMALKKQLAEERIYVPTLWPNVLSMKGTLESDYAENILPLPCDQRYNEEDMQYLLERLYKCLN